MAIEIHNLSIYDDELLLVNKLCFSMKPNVIHALVGESGSGKTLIGRYLLNQNFDNLHYKIERWIHPPNIKVKSWIPQNNHESLNPLLTIKYQLNQIHQQFHGSKASFEKLSNLLTSVKLVKTKMEAKNLLKKFPNELSGGMKQRILVLFSLISNANFILADEPTSALDGSNALESLKLFKQLFKQNKNNDKYFLIISHDLNSLANIVDHIDVMYAGQIIESGPTTQILTNPSHPYTQALLNSIPNSKTKAFKIIKGQLERNHVALTGCSFAPRCEKTTSQCNKKIAKEKRIINQETQSYYKCIL